MITLTEKEARFILRLTSNRQIVGMLMSKLTMALKEKAKVNPPKELNKNNLQLQKSIEKYRDKLIKSQTEAEKVMKAKLKAAFIPYRFQEPIVHEDKFFFVDFYLPELNLALEVDGEYHQDRLQKDKDEFRTHKLLEYGIRRVKRLTNKQAFDISPEALKEFINKEVKDKI